MHLYSATLSLSPVTLGSSTTKPGAGEPMALIMASIIRHLYMYHQTKYSHLKSIKFNRVHQVGTTTYVRPTHPTYGLILIALAWLHFGTYRFSERTSLNPKVPQKKWA